LQLLKGTDHVSYHGALPTDAARSARAGNARSAASAGNARITTEQRAQAARNGWRNMARVEIACVVCGIAVVAAFPDRARYCGGTCRARARRARLAGRHG
jgi:hypothetical protein